MLLVDIREVCMTVSFREDARWRDIEVIGVYISECEIKGFTQREARVFRFVTIRQFERDA